MPLLVPCEINILRPIGLNCKNIGIKLTLEIKSLAAIFDPSQTLEDLISAA